MDDDILLSPQEVLSVLSTTDEQMDLGERLEVLLDELHSEDAQRMRDAFVEIEQILRTGKVHEEDEEHVTVTILNLASSSRWQMRRAVAHAIRYLRNDDIDPLLSHLMADDNDYVAREAKKTAHHRMERSLIGHLPMALDEQLERELIDIEKKYNRRVRDVAVRLGLYFTHFMVDAMNHQVKAAMTPVGACLEGLDRALRKDEGRTKELDYVRDAKAQLGRAQRVLNDSLKYVKRTPPRYRKTKVSDVIDAALDSVRHLAPAAENGFEPVVDLPDTLEIEAVADLLTEALVNVLKNAVEASAAHRPIPLRIAARRLKGNVEITIRDQGVGMSPRECEHDVWKPYGSKKKGGTGLGMPLVKKIIEVDHRGRVKVASKPGSGALVTITLPALQKG